MLATLNSIKLPICKLLFALPWFHFDKENTLRPSNCSHTVIQCDNRLDALTSIATVVNRPWISRKKRKHVALISRPFNSEHYAYKTRVSAYEPAQRN